MTHGVRAGSEEDRAQLHRLQLKYRNVFGTEDGKEVLGDILRMLGYWDHDTQNPDLRAAAIAILTRGGWLHERNTRALVEGYIRAGQVNDIEPAIDGERTWQK